MRRKQELEALISSAENDVMLSEAESKKQELADAKSFVEDARQELKSEIYIYIIIFSSMKCLKYEA